MLEFQTFGYLDLQKTGSTFIRKVLLHSVKEPPVSTDKHSGFTTDFDPNKFYFISVRDPLDAYSSLYRYGSRKPAGGGGGGGGGRKTGAVRSSLAKAGLDDLYGESQEHFVRWLNHVLDPANAETLGRQYQRGPVNLIGLHTFRFISLAVPNARPLLRECKSREEVVKLYQDRSIAKAIVRNESLNDNLKDLIRGPIAGAFESPQAAVDYIDQQQPINRAPKNDALTENLDPAILNRIMDREWFYFDVLNYPRYL